MTCHPHRESPRRRVLDAIAKVLAAGDPNAGVMFSGRRGGLAIAGGVSGLTRRSVLTDLRDAGLIRYRDRGNKGPVIIDAWLTEAGVKAIEDHAREHERAAAKATEARMAAAGAQAASDAGDVPERAASREARAGLPARRR